MTENKKETPLWFVILIIGVVGIIYSSGLNELLDGELYTTYIKIKSENASGDTISPLHLHLFVFFYDFTKEEGSISFKLNEDMTFTRIRITFPSKVKNESLKTYLERDGKRYEISQDNWELVESPDRYPKSNILKLTKELKGKDNDRFSIQFKSDFKPKGRFKFILNDKIVLHGDNNIGNINFILGEEYQCIYPCIYKAGTIEEEYNSFDKNIKLRWQTDREQPNNSFYINAFSRKILFRKNLFLALSTGIFIAALLKFLSLIIKSSNTKGVKTIIQKEKAKHKVKKSKI